MRPPSTRGAGDQKYPASLHCHTPLRTLGLPDKGHRRGWKAVGTRPCPRHPRFTARFCTAGQLEGIGSNEPRSRITVAHSTSEIDGAQAGLNPQPCAGAT